MDEIPEAEPFEPFGRWLAEAWQSESDANAASLATATRDGAPSARIVLLKGFDPRGFVFYTNLESRKSLELIENPRAALCFFWKSLRRQVRVEGGVAAVSAAEADAYFASRPRESRIGAWASDQSRPLASPDALIAKFDAAARRFADAEVPRPPHWSGFRVIPERVEFWHERPFRMHDRLVFTRDGQGWVRSLLDP